MYARADAVSARRCNRLRTCATSSITAGMPTIDPQMTVSTTAGGMEKRGAGAGGDGGGGGGGGRCGGGGDGGLPGAGGRGGSGGVWGGDGIAGGGDSGCGGRGAVITLYVDIMPPAHSAR